MRDVIKDGGGGGGGVRDFPQLVLLEHRPHI